MNTILILTCFQFWTVFCTYVFSMSAFVTTKVEFICWGKGRREGGSNFKNLQCPHPSKKTWVY